MATKSLIVPERRRKLAPPFAWIDRRFLFDGFLTSLSPLENLLYFFLVLVADRDGLSYYGYDNICGLLEISPDDYIQARNKLVQKRLIAFDGRQFQVLALPEKPAPEPLAVQPDKRRPAQAHPLPQAPAEIFSRIQGRPQTPETGERR